MRIHSNDLAIRAVRTSTEWADRSERAARELSSGERVSGAADDGAAFVVSRKLRAQLGGLRQTVQNLQNIISVYDVIDQTQQQVLDIGRRMTELAVRAKSTGTITDEELSALRNEFRSLATEVTRIGDMTTWGGRSLGTYSGTYFGPDARIQLSEHAGDFFDPIPLGQSNDFVGMYRDIQWEVDEENALEYLDVMHTEFEQNVRRHYLEARTRAAGALGSAQARLSSLTEAESRLADADMAHAATERVRAGVMLSAGVAMAAQASQLPGTVLRLLT